MKVTTTSARRKLVEGILAPQLHTLHHRRTGKLLRLVAIPNSARGDYLRQCYAEAMLDLLDQNNLIVVRKPDPAADYPEGQPVTIDVDDQDLDTPPTPEPVQQQQRTYRAMKPGDDLADVWPDSTDTPIDLVEHAPGLVADTMPEDTASAHISRSVAGLRPDDDARAQFERLGARLKAREFITKMMAPLLQRMGCVVTVMDNADTRPDGKPTKATIFVDLPTDNTGGNQ